MVQEPRNKNRSDDSNDGGDGARREQDKFAQRGAQMPRAQSEQKGGEGRRGQLSKADRTPGRSMSTPSNAPAGPASPFTLLSQLSLEMDRLFDGFWRAPFGIAPQEIGRRGERALSRGQGSGSSADAFWMPAVELHEHDGDLVVRADLPGLEEDDVQVEVIDDVLTIQGERVQDCETSHEGLYRSECRYGSFFRSIPLPEGVDPNAIEASFENGVLEVRMPKPERRDENRRRIDVRSKGSSGARGERRSASDEASQSGG